MTPLEEKNLEAKTAEDILDLAYSCGTGITNLADHLRAYHRPTIIKAMEEYATLQLTSTRKRVEELEAVLKGYEQWEADILSEDKLWWPNRAKDVLRGKIYNTMLELQEKRNAALNNKTIE
jgi:hypothetical protein